MTDTSLAASGPNTSVRRGPLVTVTALTGLVAAIFSVVLSPLLPALQTEYDISLGAATWALNVLLLASAAGFVILPRAADIHGDRAAVCASASLIAAGSVVCAAISNHIGLVVGSALLGLGSSGAVLGLALLRRHLPGGSLQTAVMVLTLVQGAGIAAGYVAGGFILRYASLTGMFLTFAAISAVMAIAAWFFIPAGVERGVGKMAIPSTTFLITTVLLLLLGLAQAPSWGYTDVRVLLLVIVGVAGMVTWAAVERRAAAPVFDLDLFTHSAVTRCCVGAVLMGGVISAPLILWSFYLQMPPEVGYGFGKDAFAAGLVLCTGGITIFLSSFVGAWAVDRGHGMLATRAGALIVIVGFGGIALAHASLWHFIVASFVFGFGQGLAIAALYGVPQLAVGEEKSGMVTGLLSVAASIGTAAAAAVFLAILTSSSVPGLPGVPRENLFTVCYLVTIGLALATVVVVRAPRRTT